MAIFLDIDGIPQDAIVTESEILGKYLDESELFRRFYENQWTSVKSKVFWLNDQKLDELDRLDNSKFALMQHTNEEYFVRINPAYNHSDPELIIVHEMTHIIIQESGFPMVGPIIYEDEQSKQLSVFFNEMLHDPLVINKMVKNGYDLRQEYNGQFEGLCDGIEKKVKDDISGLKETVVIFWIVQFLLECHLIFEPNICRKYCDRIRSIIPKIFNKSFLTYNRINEKNMCDKKNFIEIIKGILTHYKLNHLLFIVK